MQKKRSKLLFALFVLLSVFCMVMIFSFSYQGAGDSQKASVSLYDLFLSYTGFDFITHNAFRKLAHFTEFAALGFCYCAALYFWKNELHPIRAFILAALYAVSDEIHQIFVPGRACKIFDVFVDSGGAFCGISIFVLIILIARKNQRQV